MKQTKQMKIDVGLHKALKIVKEKNNYRTLNELVEKLIVEGLQKEVNKREGVE